MKSAIFLALMFPLFAAAAPRAEFAVLEQMGSRVNRVVVQGDRGAGNSESLGRICSEKSCVCEVYFEEGVLELPALRASEKWNTVSCRALEGMDPASVSHARVKGPGFETPKLLVKRALTLSDVVGRSSLQKVRRVYRYGCDRTFLEGEGVSPAGVACVAHQRLGLVRAKYDFYLFASALENNMTEKGGDEAFPRDVCGYNGSLRMSCTGSRPELVYGLHGERQGPFDTAVLLATRPGAAPSLTGHAALTDVHGDCPTGLVAAAPFVAEPESMGYGRHGSLPTNFVNAGSVLNNTVLSVRAPEAFRVSREANAVPCDGAGDCGAADFREPELAQSVAYTRLTPTVCVIPRHLVLGL